MLPKMLSGVPVGHGRAARDHLIFLRRDCGEREGGRGEREEKSKGGVESEEKVKKVSPFEKR